MPTLLRAPALAIDREHPRPAPSVSGRAYRRAAWAAAGTVVALVLLLLDVRASGQGVLRPLRAGTEGPAAAAIAADFPQHAIPDDIGVDGQLFYAMARDPWHPEAVATNLDRPRYRYQRPLLPVLAWALHPSGGGVGLVVALVAVNLAGLFLGGLALGQLSDRAGGPEWLGLLFPLLPGALWSLLTGVADGLAVALALATIAAFLSERTRLAYIAAVAAVLTRETAILVPLALVLARRRRADLPVLVAPAVALGLLFVAVHLWVPAGGLRPESPVLPFTGLKEAVTSRWLQGRDLTGMGATVSALVVAGYVLVRRHGPAVLRWVILLQLGFLSICSAKVLGDDFGGTRSTLLLLAVGCACLLGARSPTPAPAGARA